MEALPNQQSLHESVKAGIDSGKNHQPPNTSSYLGYGTSLAIGSPLFHIVGERVSAAIKPLLTWIIDYHAPIIQVAQKLDSTTPDQQSAPEDIHSSELALTLTDIDTTRHQELVAACKAQNIPWIDQSPDDVLAERLENRSKMTPPSEALEPLKVMLDERIKPLCVMSADRQFFIQTYQQKLLKIMSAYPAPDSFLKHYLSEHSENLQEAVAKAGVFWAIMVAQDAQNDSSMLDLALASGSEPLARELIAAGCFPSAKEPLTEEFIHLFLSTPPSKSEISYAVEFLTIFNQADALTGYQLTQNLILNSSSFTARRTALFLLRSIHESLTPAEAKKPYNYVFRADGIFSFQNVDKETLHPQLCRLSQDLIDFLTNKIPEETFDTDAFEQEIQACGGSASDYLEIFTKWVADVCKVRSFFPLDKQIVQGMAQWLKEQGFASVVEVMAGTGFLSSALANEGIDIKATDNFKYFKDTDSESFLYVQPLVENKGIDETLAEETRNPSSYKRLLLISGPPSDPDNVRRVADNIELWLKNHPDNGVMLLVWPEYIDQLNAHWKQTRKEQRPLNITSMEQAIPVKKHHTAYLPYFIQSPEDS
ncbi:hypothetical protein [Endozoicomonas arenosclerae]|uniref:hypothetical protein n=1 Tax=Endozoicomonas arenosclerae TaxID=1633495 RepID=UPI0007815F28|nr:hypothetical protein [Endozoicomonas arenosclerae]